MFNSLIKYSSKILWSNFPNDSEWIFELIKFSFEKARSKSIGDNNEDFEEGKTIKLLKWELQKISICDCPLKLPQLKFSSWNILLIFAVSYPILIKISNKYSKIDLLLFSFFFAEIKCSIILL